MFRLQDPGIRVQRILQAVALGFGIALAILSVHTGILWTDGQVYWEAGQRAAAGQPLYPAGVDPETAYKYAPWFAWAWALLTFLPEPLVAGAWTVAMVAAWALPTTAMLRMGWAGRAVAALAAPPLLIAALGGNVQPAVVALLWAFLDRRWGPLAIGLAASLKLFPALFAVTYLARREWGRALTALVAGAVLWLPVLAYEFDAYPSAIGGALSLWVLSPVVYIAAVAVAAVWALHRPSWPASSVLVIIGASVRFIPYHLGYLLCSVPAASQPSGDREGRRESA
ncbi:MAG: glycosyltransferase family 87 protein [Chloroflexota bacterium]